MNVESEAVAKVKEIINRTNHLESFIPENDKTPVWDGFIMVYSKPQYPPKKKDIIGRVSVQVKGRKVDNIPTKHFTYPVEVSDLNAFLTEGGAIFFVVAITEDFKKETYYNMLLPFDIERILRKYSEQKTVNLKFETFPSNNETIVSLFYSFITNRKKQTSTVNPNKLFLEEWAKDRSDQMSTYTIPLSFVKGSQKSPFEVITSLPQYLYIGHDEFQDIQIPVDKMDSIIVEEDRYGEIEVNKRQYYKKYKIVWEQGDFSFHFGRGLSMKFQKIDIKKQTYKTNINLNLQGTLKERITDVEFFLNYFESKT